MLFLLYLAPEGINRMKHILIDKLVLDNLAAGGSIQRLSPAL